MKEIQRKIQLKPMIGSVKEFVKFAASQTTTTLISNEQRIELKEKAGFISDALRA